MSADDNPGATEVRHDHAVRFLNFLFYGMSRGYVEFRFTDGGRRQKPTQKPAFHSLPINAANAAREVLGVNGGQDVFVGPDPRYRVPDGRRPGTDQEVLTTTCLWADLDYRRVEGGAVEAIRRIQEFPLRPSIVVDSDYGRQLYFVFSEPASAGRLLTWDKSMRGLSELFGGDGAVSPSGVLPLPGSNHVDDRSGGTSFLLSDADSGWLRYSLEELEGSIRRHLEVRRAASRRAAPTKARKAEAAAAGGGGPVGKASEEGEQGPAGFGPAGALPGNALPPSYERDADG